MDIAILILVIVAVILLGIVTFFIFQIWVQSKEAKIQLTNHLQEIQKGFSNSDNNLKTLNLQLIESIGIENKGLVNAIDQLKEEIKDLQAFDVFMSNEFLLHEYVGLRTIPTHYFSRVSKLPEMA